MEDNIYRNSFQEVYIILENTEKELLDKIPNKFMNFIKDNRNVNYETNIRNDLELDKQNLLKETESILSLIYRSYWATEEEKKEFAQKDQQEIIEIENKKQKEYAEKDIYEIFKKRKDIEEASPDNNLMVIKKENFILKIFNKILSIFRK